MDLKKKKHIYTQRLFSLTAFSHAIPYQGLSMCAAHAESGGSPSRAHDYLKHVGFPGSATFRFNGSRDPKVPDWPDEAMSSAERDRPAREWGKPDEGTCFLCTTLVMYNHWLVSTNVPRIDSFYFIDIHASDHALTHAFPLFELPDQTKTIQGVIRNLSAMNLASQAVRQATNEASLKMTKALLRFVDSDDLLAKRSEIDGCIDLELSVTALGRTMDTTAEGFMLAVKRKVDDFVKEDRVFLPVRTSLEHMRAAAKAVLEFAFAANLYSTKLRAKTEDGFRGPLVVALNCLGLSCDNSFRKHILEPIYHGALTTNPIIGLNLFKFCRLPGIDISFFYPTPSAASGAAHEVFSPCTPPPSPQIPPNPAIPSIPTNLP